LQQERRKELRAPSKTIFSASWQRDGFGVSEQLHATNASHSGYGFQCSTEVPVGTVVYLQSDDVSTIGCGVVRHCKKSPIGFGVGVELDEATKEASSLSGLSTTNYYEFLQISPNAQNETIQRIYRFLAARYHPDNPETGNAEKFLYLNQAYKVLSDPKRRSPEQAAPSEFTGIDFLDGIEGELNRRLAVLAVLYRRCRSNVNDPRISLMELETLMGFPREYLDFTTWYLRSKGYLKKEDNSDFSLTVLGVDFVEENHTNFPLLNKLLSSGAPQGFSSNGSEGSVRPKYPAGTPLIPASGTDRNGAGTREHGPVGSG
jgi:curved DNA-binding protein